MPASVPVSSSSPAPRDGSRLTPAHRHELEVGSGIDPRIIRERGYASVTPDRLVIGFTPDQRRDGIAIPILNVHGKGAALQLKPDTPRTGAAGRVVKYEWMPGQPLCLDVPRRVQPLLADPGTPLWITEGAKKVDSALSHGIDAIIGLQGVWGWRGKISAKKNAGTGPLKDWDAIQLNGRDVVIAFDSDCMTKESVRTALTRLAAFLTNRGAIVGYCLMPHLPDGAKCGLDDFFVNGGTMEGLSELIVPELPPLEPDDAAEATVAEAFWVSDVDAENIDWLWKGWIPKRMLTILGGFGGDGKSTVMASLIAKWTTGGRLPDDTLAPKTKVLMLSAEDDVAYAIRPRLEAHGADIGKVMVLKGTRTQENPSSGRESGGELPDATATATGRRKAIPPTTRWLDLRRDVATMEALITAHDIGLVVIDPLSSYLPNADRNSEGDIRDALQPLMSLVERTGVGVVGIMHVGKSADNRRAAQRLLGSTAFTALARSVLMVADLPPDRQPDDIAENGKVKVLEVVKANYAMPPAARLFRRPLDGAIRWEGESALTVEECFAGMNGKPGPNQEDRNDAVAMIRELLINGPVEASEVLSMAKASGISERTLRRAKKELGIQVAKAGFQGAWTWHLPVSATTPKGGHVTP